MYVLYLDESGLHAEASHFILAGLAVFEREIHWYAQDMDALQEAYLPGLPEPAHFHASQLRVPDGGNPDAPWDRLSAQQRRELKDRVLDTIRGRRGVLFSSAVEKRWAEAHNIDPYERAFEDLVSRFDMFLSRVNRAAVAEGKDEQRGMLVLAESSYRKTLAVLARQLQATGTRWGTQLHNIADVPLFAPAPDTRLLQLADFCSNAIYGRYQGGLTRDFDRIAARFDQDNGVLHGLVHHTIDPLCGCIACFSRRMRPPAELVP